ncbi:MAG: DUF2865 domain-containing protein [Hyphomicrobiales bacterium]|nr:DUF2865 domain-containing protein [Hyphomicrobiales bacterium]
MPNHRADFLRGVSLRRALTLAAAASACVFWAGPAQPQGGYYPDSRYGSPPAPGYDGRGYGDGAPGYSPREMRCRELEQQLAGDWSRNSLQDQLPRLDEEIRNTERAFQRAESDAERGACYEDMFIFGRSLRRTPRCIELNRQIEDARRRLADLRQQRDNLTRSGARRQRQDDLVAELARNRCGESYQRQHAARQRQDSFFSLWDDEDSSPASGPTAYSPADAPFGTYRTLCVRMCDGYFFPISYSTLQSKFREDEDKCRSQCAAPAELFVHRNPGEEVEQAVSLSGTPYVETPNAFRNRKHFIKGCSCNASEFSMEEIAKSEQALKEDAETRRTAAARPKGEPEPAPAAPQTEEPQGPGARAPRG